MHVAVTPSFWWIEVKLVERKNERRLLCLVKMEKNCLSHRLQIIELEKVKKNNLFSLFLLRDFQNGQLIFPHTGCFVLIIQYTCITVYQMNMG